MTAKVKAILNTIVEQGNIKRKNFTGCSLEEIEKIERHFACQLPQAYKDFLLIAGKGAGKLFRGTAIFYPQILELREYAQELLTELNLSRLLPEGAIVFCMHQGYELNYFLPTSDDPPVFQFFEGQDAVTMPWQSFSEFILSTISEHLMQYSDLN